MTESYRKFLTNPQFFAQGLTLRLGQVVRTHYPDDETNTSKRNLEYDVQLYDTSGYQVLIRNVRTSKMFSSIHDDFEVVLQDSEYAAGEEVSEASLPNDRNGSFVIVGFLDGTFNRPIILGALDHPGLDDSDFTREEGIRSRSIFRGLVTEVNKLGEYSITYGGALDSRGEPLNSDQQNMVFKIGRTDAEQDQHRIVIQSGDKNKIELATIKGQRLLLDEDDPAFKLQTSDGDEVSSVGNIITVKNKNGDEITMDNGEILAKNKTGDKVALGSDSVEVAASSNAKMKLASGKVALGTTPNELLNILDLTLTQLTTALDVIAIFQHGTNTGPTSPPIQAAPVIAASIAIKLLQTQLQTIKGSL